MTSSGCRWQRKAIVHAHADTGRYAHTHFWAPRTGCCPADHGTGSRSGAGSGPAGGRTPPRPPRRHRRRRWQDHTSGQRACNRCTLIQMSHLPGRVRRSRRTMRRARSRFPSGIHRLVPDSSDAAHAVQHLVAALAAQHGREFVRDVVDELAAELTEATVAISTQGALDRPLVNAIWPPGTSHSHRMIPDCPDTAPAILHGNADDRRSGGEHPVRRPTRVRQPQLPTAPVSPIGRAVEGVRLTFKRPTGVIDSAQNRGPSRSTRTGLPGCG